MIEQVETIHVMLVTRGQIGLARKDLELARSDFEAALAFKPKNILCNYNLVLVNAWLKRLVSARKSFERLKTLTSNRGFLLFAEAVLLIGEGKDDSGVYLFRQFLKEFPKNKNAPLALANIKNYEAYLLKKKKEAEQGKEEKGQN